MTSRITLVILRAIRSILRIIPLALIFLLPTLAFARAGGGEGYHGGGGGGHGGGGGGGDGDGIGFLIWMLIRLVIYHPFIGVPLLVIIVVFFIYAQQQGTQKYQSSVIRRGSAAMDQAQRIAAMEQLRSHDPLFDEGAFLARVNVAFTKIQHAWCAQDLKEVRPFVSDGVHERFLLQFAEQKDEGYRDHMDGLTINSTTIEQVESDGIYDVLAVRIAATSTDYHESLSTGKRLSGESYPQQFAEVWSFVRRRGARTLSGKAGLIEGNCPNCGAAIELNQSANCTHCQAMLRSGEYDWVLAEITQNEEWDPSQHGERPGMAALRQRDPDFNATELEDRASVMFWRKASADRLGKIDPLRKIASPAFADSYAAQLRSAPGLARTFFGDCAVGSVELLGVIAADAVEKSAVEIRWSAKRFIAAPGAPPRPQGENALFHTLFVLERKAGSKTEIGKGISSAHCPTCGAPESNSESNACDYCGAILNDGTHGWVLSDITARTEPRGQALMQELSRAGAATPINGNGNAQPYLVPGKLGVLSWMVKVAAADGNVDENERRMLTAMAAGQNVDPAQVDRMIDAARTGTMQAPAPADRNEAEAWLASMAQTALADGKLVFEEYQLLCNVGESVGLSETDVKLLINRVKAERYETSVRALRQQRARIGKAQ